VELTVLLASDISIKELMSKHSESYSIKKINPVLKRDSHPHNLGKNNLI
jgi:hypothetical protein